MNQSHKRLKFSFELARNLTVFAAIARIEEEEDYIFEQIHAKSGTFI
jgi:hypothetical protein